MKTRTLSSLRGAWFAGALLALLLPVAASAADLPHQMVFDGVLSEHKIALKDLDAALPSDWTGYTHLVLEMKTSSPQRFGLWAYTADGPHRIEIQPALALEPGAAEDDEALRRNVARVTAAIEQAIRAWPGQWTWTHRRWRTRPEGEPEIY